jgi:hypothetical protein
VFSEVNTDPRNFEDMTAYAGDPFHDPADAFLRNIFISPGFCILMFEFYMNTSVHFYVLTRNILLPTELHLENVYYLYSAILHY